jgi:hypothetical protein
MAKAGGQTATLISAPDPPRSGSEVPFRGVKNGTNQDRNGTPARHRGTTYSRCQRERVERLAGIGLDTTEAKRTLDLFARTLDICEDDLRRMLGEDWKRDPF